MNPYKEVEDGSFTTSLHVSYEDIATKLLKDHYFLTALELHTELVEGGRELPQLREFFSNPGNFEQHVPRPCEQGLMHRTPSQATLDSLDTARYSEDGGGDRGCSGGDVAVLEFELRKAKETINALRANLTQFADGDSALDKSSKDKYDQRPLKPHEKRALNFLINEYLLLQNYKLTSITFSDENPDQEFEDWDDVGLNMPRPAGLVSLLWGGSSTMSVPKVDQSTQTESCSVDSSDQTDFDEMTNVCVSCQTSLDNDTDWNHELLIQAEEIDLLKQKIVALETEKLNFQKLYDAAIISLNSLTSPVSENKGIDLQIPGDKMTSVQTTLQQLDAKPLTCTAAENHYGSGHSTHSATPEQFEMIDNEKNSVTRTKDGSNTSSFEPGVLEGSAQASPRRRGSATTLDDTLSINDAAEWTRVHYDYAALETNKEMWIDSRLPSSLKETILSWCCESLNLNEPLANDLLSELVSCDKPITLPGLLPLVADTLPRILPHTLVARRGEAAAALAAAAALLPAGDARRARLLHSLLTLVKKPDPPDVRAICEVADHKYSQLENLMFNFLKDPLEKNVKDTIGVFAPVLARSALIAATCLIVKWGGSGEVLSTIAELLASRSSERRVLASQICLAIAPYVPIELCTSLLLSLVVLMCESSEGEIRSLGLKSACLICPVADHKYSQLENLMFNFLKDPLEKNVKDTIGVFAPVLARSALIAGKFSSDLYSRIITNLVKASTDNEWKSVLLYLDVMRVLVLAKLAFVINVQIVRDITLSNCDTKIINLQEIPLESDQFLDLQCYMTDSADAKMLLVAMNSLLKTNSEVRWTELTWFINMIKQILEVAVSSKAVNQPIIYEIIITLFNSYVDNFGSQFTSKILSPIFIEIMTDLENKLEKLHTVDVNRIILVGIYLVTILVAIEDNAQHGEFLQKWVMYSSLRSLPPKIFAVPLKWLAKRKPDVLNSYLQHLREFAASSCDSSSGSAVRVYIAGLITELLLAAELSEECIERQLLPAVMAFLYDDDVSVREVAITAWGSLTRSCVVRGLACEAQCWPPVEDLLGSRPLTVKESVKAAEALAGLVLPAVDSPAVSEKAVSLVCALSSRAAPGEAGEALAALGALAPALQLAAHRAPRHPALLPALRKLEEAVQAPALSQYKPAIEALLHVVGSGESREPPRASNLHTAQEVGRRVTQMFQHSKTNMNLQNIFKKKT